MIKRIQKKVQQFKDITQFYCDCCNSMTESEGIYCPNGWTRLSKSGVTILTMTDVLVCSSCYDNKLIPWLESQKKNIKPTV